MISISGVLVSTITNVSDSFTTVVPSASFNLTLISSCAVSNIKSSPMSNVKLPVLLFIVTVPEYAERSFADCTPCTNTTSHVNTVPSLILVVVTVPVTVVPSL